MFTFLVSASLRNRLLVLAMAAIARTKSRLRSEALTRNVNMSEPPQRT